MRWAGAKGFNAENTWSMGVPDLDSNDCPGPCAPAPTSPNPLGSGWCAEVSFVIGAKRSSEKAEGSCAKGRCMRRNLYLAKGIGSGLVTQLDVSACLLGSPAWPPFSLYYAFTCCHNQHTSTPTRKSLKHACI